MFAAFLAITIVLPVLFAASARSADDKVIRIPYLTNFTGPSAPFSLRVWRGAEIAMNEINAKGGVRGGHKLDLYKIDNRSETQTALTEYRRACADRSVPMFVAAVGSKDVLALYEVAKTCNMATFATTSGSHWVYPDNGKWILPLSSRPVARAAGPLQAVAGRIRHQDGCDGGGNRQPVRGEQRQARTRISEAARHRDHA